MITTPELIDSLAADAAPVRRLRAPALRAAAWLLFAAFVFGLIGVSHGVRPDLAQKARDAVYVAGVAAALLTGVLAALAAFMLSLPDRSRRWLLLPMPPLVVWLASVGYGCLAAWVGLGPAGVSASDVAQCFATLVLTSVPIWAALLFMLRHAARLRPVAATMMASLAVAAMSAAGLLLFHAIDATAMILVWNIGGAALVLTLGSIFGGRVYARIGPRRPPTHG
jgi:hypothetical protein